MKELGILENAFNVGVKRRVNTLWTASFSLPSDDPKNGLCKHFNYVDIYGASGRHYGLYRIMPAQTKKNLTTDAITYKLEHVLSTLLDDVIEGLLPALINQSTAVNINRILNFQTTRNWVLGRCDFERYFQYSFEDENGLLAPIFSIPKPFDEPYEFTFDTQSYPWKLNIIKPDNKVKSEIRWGKDMIDFDEVSDPTEIVNHIIPKGAGEGVNKLTIESVNGGKKYLEDAQSVAEWGVKKYIWIDQRFTDAGTLKANAQSLLTQWKNPKISFKCDSVDLSIHPDYQHEPQKLLNSITRIIVEEKEYEARIIGDDYIDVIGSEFDVVYEIDNRLDNIADVQADVERRQQVNEAYSQGATNIMAFSYQDNCDSNIPALIPIYIDDDVLYVNTCELTFRTKKFRAYSQATDGGGATVQSTSGGGGATPTSSSSGEVSKTTASGGSLQSSTGFFFPGDDFITMGPAVTDYDIHWHRIPEDRIEHSHTFSIPNHTHNFQIPAHTHTVTIDNHTHDVTLPNHTHKIKHGIYELEEEASTIEIYVDGNKVTLSGKNGDRIDLIPYLAKTNGKVTRGRHEITIHPSSLARIEADIILRVFIQSHLGGTY